MKFTDTEIEVIRQEIDADCMGRGHIVTLLLDALDCIETLRRHNIKLLKLETALRVVTESDDYESGHISHWDNCNTAMAWGSEEPKCDCPVRAVHQALDILNGSILDDLSDASK